MTKEHRPQSDGGFDLSKHERLFGRISHTRFEQLVFDNQTTIHQVKVDSNSYGEFVFLTARRPQGQGHETLMFWGLGLHEHRDRWLTDEWFYDLASSSQQILSQNISQEQAQMIIQTRRIKVLQDAVNSEQSAIGALFEMLADLTDDDGALSEMEDLGCTLFDDRDEEI